MGADGFRGGALVAGAAGALLLVLMFLPWFEAGSIKFDIEQLPGVTLDIEGLPTEFEFSEQEVESLAGQSGQDTSADAWDSLGFIKLMLVLAAGAAIGLLVTNLAGFRLPRVAYSVVAGLGVLATALVLFRVISPPEFLELSGGLVPTDVDAEISIGRQIGVWLGLLAAAGVALGGFVALSAGVSLPPSRRVDAPPVTPAR